ncbi:MAG TPA: ribonuclease Y [Armatimonadota bacterium]|nr:ribonuclease Y [Armatimonadota bacterium]
MPDAVLYIILILFIVLLVLSSALMIVQSRSKSAEIDSLRDELAEKRQNAQTEAESLKQELLMSAEKEALKLRKEVEQEHKEARAELQLLERRLFQKEESLERKIEHSEERSRELLVREAELERHRKEIDQLNTHAREELERIARLTTSDAQSILLKRVESETRHEAASLIRRVEEEAKAEADRRARKIVSLAIQRCAVDQAAEAMVSVVPLPSDDMKGRIIGREGRNIRAFENLTGVNLIIDDTPEAVVISGFDKVRREIARMALEVLVADGRIHPGRIEDVVARARLDVESKIQEAAERAVEEAGVVGLHPELHKVLGRLLYRASYGQNCLNHSVEVSHLAVLMAAELGADTEVCRRAGLLHDIGKAADMEMEGPHHHISRDLALRFGESRAVAHAIEAHHEDIAPETVEAVLVQVADALSASRPGARRETLENYVHRLEKLEAICDSFPGVEKSFVMQAGRELRVMVQPEAVSDHDAEVMAREICRRIDEEVQHPGQIKVSVIRETRAVEYAK